MNLLKENALNSMTNAEKWLLAAAYLHAGIGRTANEIARTVGVAVEDYREFANTYGSGLRDEALILDASSRLPAPRPRPIRWPRRWPTA